MKGLPSGMMQKGKCGKGPQCDEGDWMGMYVEVNKKMAIT